MRMTLVIVAALAVAGCKQAMTDEGDKATANAGNEAVATEVAIPDLKGKWVGTGESIVTGMAKHHEAPEGDEPLLDNVAFTYVVEGQDGHRFWGTLSSPNFEEQMTGVVSNDGKTIVARSSEGEVYGKILDADTIDVVYSGGGNAMVMAVNTWKRTR